MNITCVVDDRAERGLGLKAEHGVSFFIEAGGRSVLFDTGQSGPVLLSNLAALGFSPAEIDALVLSHAHYDHTGGLPSLFEQVQGLALHAHPDLFRERFRKTDTGPKQVGPSMGRAEVQEYAVLQLSDKSSEVAPGVWTSGEITPRPEPEGRSAYHTIRQGAGWSDDPYRDDLSLVIEAPEGLVLVCGCCHAGLLNTLATVRCAFGRDPVAVVGGVHLIHADAPTMDHVIEELPAYGPPRLWLGHCTGDRALLRLKAAFGDLVAPCRAGTVLRF